MSDLKPMLASPADLKNLKFPVLASPKLDGIRCLIVDGVPLSRNLKKIPNEYIQKFLSAIGEIDGFDGELVVGSATAEDLFRSTTSGVMGRKGEPDFTFWVFDVHDRPTAYFERLEFIKERIAALHDITTVAAYALLGFGAVRFRIKVLPQRTIHNDEELIAYEAEQVELGYEGVILRDAAAHYKFGRSTTKEGILLKVKRFEDSEALVLGVEEEMFNGNVATTNELGRTKRSSAKAGKVGKGTMGALVVRDIVTGVEFNIGCGFTAKDRERTDWVDKVVKYKFFPVGVKDKPRHPVYLGDRAPGDM